VIFVLSVLSCKDYVELKSTKLGSGNKHWLMSVIWNSMMDNKARYRDRHKTLSKESSVVQY